MRKLVAPLCSAVAILVILACGGGGAVESLVSVPPIPTGLIGAAADGQAILTWNVSNGATHYNVKRSTTNGGPYTLVAGPNLPGYTDTGLVNGTTYYYVVSAESLVGESQDSAQISVKPLGNTTPVDVAIGVNFNPVTVQAKAGQVIRWTNNDFITHSVTGDTADGPDSETAHPGGMTNAMVYSWTVPAAAPNGKKYFYHCQFHGAAGNGTSLGLGMAGEIQVIP